MSKTTYTDKKFIIIRSLHVAWPAVLESFFVALAGMIDTMMVAGMGNYAVAAVGLTIQPKFMGYTVFIAVNVAVSALVARRRGENDQKRANETLYTALVVSIFLCILITALNLILAETLMRLSGSNADTHASAVLYFRIIMGGMVFNIISLAINAAQRGSGNTRIAMTTNITSSIVNVCFNYFLIGGKFGFPKMGVAGAAIATVLGSFVAMVMSILSLVKKQSYVSFSCFRQFKVHVRTEILQSIAKLGGNIMVENIAMRIGFISTAVIAARLGTDAFAVHQAGMNLLSLSFAFGDGMQVAAVALIGQSLGAGEKKDARHYGKTCQEIGFVISALLAIVMFIFGRDILGIYFSEPENIDMGLMITRFIMFITFVQISQIVFGGCLRAAGDVKYTLVASLISVTIIRTIVTYVLANVLGMGMVGIWLGVCSDQVSRFIFMYTRFRQGKWVNIKI